MRRLQRCSSVRPPIPSTLTSPAPSSTPPAATRWRWGSSRPRRRSLRTRQPAAPPRAWHLAAAATGRDAAAATALEAAGRRARERAAHASAAAAFEEAARLSEPGEARMARLLAAAENAWLAGNGGQAIKLLEAARLDPGGGLRLDI